MRWTLFERPSWANPAHFVLPTAGPATPRAPKTAKPRQGKANRSLCVLGSEVRSEMTHKTPAYPHSLMVSSASNVMPITEFHFRGTRVRDHILWPRFGLLTRRADSKLGL